MNSGTTSGVQSCCCRQRQFSLAGKEASGTGKMKFAVNGALRLFSSDRAMRQYCDEIWHAHPVEIEEIAPDVQLLGQDGIDRELTATELDALRTAATLIGYTVIYAADSGATGPSAEIAALADAPMDAGRRFPNNQLIQLLAADRLGQQGIPQAVVQHNGDFARLKAGVLSDVHERTLSCVSKVKVTTKGRNAWFLLQP